MNTDTPIKIRNKDITVIKTGRGKTAQYIARGEFQGCAYSNMSKTRTEVLATTKHDIRFVLNSKPFEYGGCSVTATGYENWQFSIGNRCIMTFGAPTLRTAIAYAARSYTDHPECREFCIGAGLLSA